MSQGALGEPWEFVKDAFVAGQSREDARALLPNFGWRVSDEALDALWHDLETYGPSTVSAAAVVAADPPVAPYVPPPVTTTSGMDLPPPEAVARKGWCWGGFGLGMIWGLAHSVPLVRTVFLGGIAVYVACAAVLMLLDAFGINAMSAWEVAWRWTTQAVAMALSIWLGLRGYKLAWRYRRFKSLQQYEETMAVWDKVGMIFFVVGVIITVAGVALLAARDELHKLWELDP